MNPHRNYQDPVADEQAALWAARIDGDTLDRAQRAELDAWLARNPSNRALLSQYCQFSADLEEQVPALVSAGALVLPKARSALRRRWTFPRLVSVVLATAAAIAITVSLVRPTQPIETVSTTVAERRPHTFSDGTRVELNAQTSLRFESNRTERRVWLSGGEALFMVAKDPARPFIVETPTGSVRVTGTTFNVLTDPAITSFEVTVIEGSVQVRTGEINGAKPGAPLSLGAGDQFSARGANAIRHVLSATDLDDTLAWRRGQVVFRRARLDEALARYARYHGRMITVRSSIASETIGGRYGIEDLSGFLDALKSAFPLTVDRDPSGVVTVSPRPGG